MAEVDDMVLETLKRIQGTLSGLAFDVSDIKTRMTSMEGQMGQVVQHIGSVEMLVAATNRRLDRLEERTARIEKRLDINSGEEVS